MEFNKFIKMIKYGFEFKCDETTKTLLYENLPFLKDYLFFDELNYDYELNFWDVIMMIKNIKIYKVKNNYELNKVLKILENNNIEVLDIRLVNYEYDYFVDYLTLIISDKCIIIKPYENEDIDVLKKPIDLLKHFIEVKIENDDIKIKTLFDVNLNKIIKGLKKKVKKSKNIDVEIEKAIDKIINKIYKIECNKYIKPIEIKFDQEIRNFYNFVMFKNNDNVLDDVLQTLPPTNIKEMYIENDNLIIIKTNNKKEIKSLEWFFVDFLKLNISNFRFRLIKVYKYLKDYEFVITDEVCKYYNECIYDYDSKIDLGSLKKSCMRYDEKNRFMLFYEKEGIKLLILRNKYNGKIIGRALVWDNCYDEQHNEFKFIDRIYGNDNVIALFKRWAYLNGYAHKKRQSIENKTKFVYKGKSIKKRIFYNLKNDIDDYKDIGIPYLDTLTYLNIEDNILSNMEDSDYCISLDDVDGNYHVLGNFEYCRDCGEPINIDIDDYIIIDGEYICSCCAEDYVYCVDVDDYVYYEDAYYYEPTGEYYYYEENIPDYEYDEE